MNKNSIILENEKVLLKAKAIIVEGILVVKAKSNGGIVLFDLNQKPLITIHAKGGPKVHVSNTIKLDSFTINYDNIMLKSEDVEIINIANI